VVLAVVVAEAEGATAADAVVGVAATVVDAAAVEAVATAGNFV
jgi:hypothetical protein